VKLYIGLKENAEPAIFDSEKEPSKEQYPQYDIVYGPFKSRVDAEKFVNAMDQGVACTEG